MVPQRTRLEVELDRAVEGVSLEARAGVAEDYGGCRGGHGIAAAVINGVSAAIESAARWVSAAQRLLGFSLAACSLQHGGFEQSLARSAAGSDRQPVRPASLVVASYTTCSCIVSLDGCSMQ